VTAGRDIDWQELESHLDCRERGVVEGLAAGHGSSELSRRYGVSAPRITQIKDHIADEITGRWGEDVLEQVSEEPIWRSSLRAKEKCV